MRWTAVLSLVSAVLMAVPAGSAAQGVPSDPEADSPSGVVYEIPVEQARQDAAPKRTRRSDGPSGTAGAGSGGSSGSSGSGGGGTSSGADASHTKQTSIRSENNFGTSSKVPGASGGGGRSLGDLAKSSVETGAGTTSGPDDGVVFPLVALLLAVGAGIGVVAGRRALGPRRA
jgi:hypothetical protein